jgi:pimeloyl-ACP methyl ester carboxylesterase
MWRDTTIDNRGVCIATRDYGGGGRAVVLIHGGPGQNLATWDAFAPMLGPDLRAIALDMRGNGASCDADDYSYPSLASDVDAVVRHYGLTRPIVIGHSWGGQIAIYYASRNPDCGGVIGIDGWVTDVRQDFGDDAWDWVIKEYRADPLLTFAGNKEQLDALMKDVDQSHGTSVAEVVRRQFVEHEDGTLMWRRSVDELVNIERTVDREGTILSSELYGMIACPVLLIGGERSAAERDPRAGTWAFSRDATHPIVERFERLRAVWFPCGHDIPHEMPDELAREVLAFVAAC